MLEKIKNEPVMLFGLLQALLTLLVVFGVGLSPEQIAAVEGLGAIVIALLTRQFVIPRRNVAALKDETAQS